jgi:hypothetical protein
MQDIIKLSNELQYAISKTSTEELLAIATNVPFLFVHSTARRFNNTKELLKNAGKYLSKESKELFSALVNKNLEKYIDKKEANIKSALKEFENFSKEFTKKLQNDPQTNLSNLVIFILGAYLGSGGIDGDGGIPDTDLLFSIGDHRSIFTHSIIAGIVVEVMIMTTIISIDMLYDKLPTNHSKIWDSLHEKKDEFLFNFTKGVSSGLAYHFAIDSTIDIGTYKHLPFSMPIEMHQFIMGTNSVMEGADAVYKKLEDLKRIKLLKKRLSLS